MNISKPALVNLPKEITVMKDETEDEYIFKSDPIID